MQLPAGTVTFLFTDIEGSTRLLQQLGENYRPVRMTTSDHAPDDRRGRWDCSWDGRGLFAVFADHRAAVRTAMAAQRALAAHSWPPGAQFRVRMGLHTGRGELGGDNYVGIDVNQAARIAPAGHGGQVLLSEATPVQSARQAGEVRRRGADAA
jgi:class 3 adenylate cyclase